MKVCQIVIKMIMNAWRKNVQEVKMKTKVKMDFWCQMGISQMKRYASLQYPLFTWKLLNIPHIMIIHCEIQTVLFPWLISLCFADLPILCYKHAIAAI